MKIVKVAVAAVLIALVATGCRPLGSGTVGGAEGDGGQGVNIDLETIPGVVSTKDGMSTLAKAVTAAGIAETLAGAGPYTLFAPTDDAFAALPAGTVDALLLPTNKATLTKILNYHVLAGENPSYTMLDGDLPTVEGQSVAIVAGADVMVNDATITEYDVYASNGLIHVIDTVLIPPDVDLASLSAQ